MVYTNNVIKKLNKTFLILISFLTVLSSSLGFKNNQIFAETSRFAQIKNSNTFLLKSAELDTTFNKWCYLEKSYFVKVLSEYNSNYYKVEYNGIYGYVNKSDVCLVNEIPKTPYPNSVTFKTGSSNCYLRDTPQIKSVTNNTICVIPANTELEYLGKIIGEEAVDFNGSVWYLTNYNGNLGYIYSGYTNSITEVKPNTEIVTEFLTESFSNINPLSNTSCLIIIFLTLIPCIFILIMLYSPKKAKINNLHSNKTNSKIINNYENYFEENL